MKLGIRLQLVLALGGLFVLAFVPLFFAVSSLTRASLRAEREEHARAMGRVVAARVAEAQMSRAPGELAALVEAQIGSHSGVRAIAVYDQKGTAVARAGDPDGVQALEAKLAPDVEEIRPRVLASGRVVQVVVPGPKGTVATLLRTDDASARVGPLMRLLGLYTGLVALALLVFVYFSLTRLVVQPIDALSRSARRITSGGTRLESPVGGAAELIELGQSLGEMTTRLRDEEEAQRAKVNELEKATAELRAAQEHVVRSERLASVGRLAAGLAHEVGNPLAALLGLQDLLLDGGLTPEEEKDFVARMRKETERIHRIIRDLLDYARPAAAAGQRTSEAGNVELALEDVTGLLRPQKTLRDVELLVEIEPSLPMVALAHEQLVQITLNLVSNASDATGGQGRIWVRARSEGDGVRIEVEDDGPGVAESVAQTLFEPFVTTKDVGEGTGLGLSVCRGLVEGVGGSIGLLPRPAGARGALFVVQIPTAEIWSQRSSRRA